MSADRRRKSARANGAASAPDLSQAAAGPLAFEEALSQLDATVAALEDGQLSLEEALARYEHGVRLAAHCQELLDQAALRVQVLQQHDDDTAGRGTPFTLQPFEVDDEDDE